MNLGGAWPDDRLTGAGRQSADLVGHLDGTAAAAAAQGEAVAEGVARNAVLLADQCAHADHVATRCARAAGEAAGDDFRETRDPINLGKGVEHLDDVRVGQADGKADTHILEAPKQTVVPGAARRRVARLLDAANAVVCPFRHSARDVTRSAHAPLSERRIAHLQVTGTGGTSNGVSRVCCAQSWALGLP